MILLGLGANLPSQAGAPAETLRAALAEFSNFGMTVRVVSRFYENAAWPDPADPVFTNAVVRIGTKLTPHQLLERLHTIENLFGRSRDLRNAPRTLDLDIIDYEGRVETGPPRLPHPGIQDRIFVLEPLAEIVPDWRHPVTGVGVADMLAALKTRATR